LDAYKRIFSKVRIGSRKIYYVVDTSTRFNVYSFRLIANRYIFKSSCFMGYRSNFSMGRSFLSKYVQREEERCLGLLYDECNDYFLNWKYFYRYIPACYD